MGILSFLTNKQSKDKQSRSKSKSKVNPIKPYIPFLLDNVELTSELEIHPVFKPTKKDNYRLLIGRAGSGKSFTLNKAVKTLRQEGFKVCITASTNSAASEVNGITIHKALNCRQETIDKYEFLNLLESHHYLIIDEAYMLSWKFLKDITDIVKEFLQGKDREFYLILCGDPCQIINIKFPFYNWVENNEIYLSKNYKSYFLKGNYRQNKETDLDKLWIECLNKVRLGDCSLIPHFLSFNNRSVLPKFIEDKSLVIFPKRKQVAEFNLQCARNHYLSLVQSKNKTNTDVNNQCNTQVNTESNTQSNTSTPNNPTKNKVDCLRVFGASYDDPNRPISLGLFKGVRLCTTQKIKCIETSYSAFKQYTPSPSPAPTTSSTALPSSSPFSSSSSSSSSSSINSILSSINPDFHSTYLNKNEIITVLEVNVEEEIIHIITDKNNKEYSIDLKDCYSKQYLLYKETVNSEEIYGEIDVVPFKYGYANTIHITQGITLDEPYKLYISISPVCSLFLGSIYVALSRTKSYKQITIIIDETDFNIFKSRFRSDVDSKIIEAAYWDKIALVHEASALMGEDNTTDN